MDMKLREVVFEDGPFKEHFEGFIRYKVASGLKYDDPIRYVMRVLNSRLNRMGLQEARIDRCVVEALAERLPSESVRTQSKRCTLLREFARYLVRIGIDAYILPNDYAPHLDDSFSPYIFSPAEMRSIFDEADSLPRLGHYPHYHLVYPVLVRLLYSCGLRLSEAIHLRIKDVDLENGTLYIDKGKGAKSRVVPMNRSMTQVCRQYLGKRFGEAIPDGDTFFLQARDGNCYNKCSVRFIIKKIYERAGAPRLVNGLYPRVHDLRHTFCMHSMMKMQKSGMDLYCTLPLLSQYVGHKGLKETELYLRLPSISYGEVAESLQVVTANLFPEVHHESE
jgi:integrase/recombinase XerD